jgi:site-specific DNA-methyltransferase (adenine-specific)
VNEIDRKYHKVADIFPMMSDDEYEALKEDIATHGLLEPIWIHADGSIIDGRNRHRACVELEITPQFRTYTGDNPVAFSISQNVKRRHLSDNQRAMIAVQALPMLEAEAKAKKMVAGAEHGILGAEHGILGGRGNKKNPLEAPVPQGGFSEAPPRAPRAPQSRDIAAAAVGVSPRLVQDAKAIANKSPELAEKVKAGEITIKAASRNLKKINQQEALAQYQAMPPVKSSIKCRLIVSSAESIPQIEDSSVNVIITSPPYNLGGDVWPMGGGGRSTRDGIEYNAHNDDMHQPDYEQWQIDVLNEMFRVAKSGASFFYNHKVRTVDGKMIHPMQWLMSKSNPWVLRQEIIWNRKSTHNHNPQLFWPIDERIYWMTKGKPILHSEKIGLPTIWEEFGPVPNTWHPAPFTEKLPKMLLDAIGVDSQTVVLDPFAGSCTTLKVALDMGCFAIGVDLSRQYLERSIVERGWNREILD